MLHLENLEILDLQFTKLSQNDKFQQLLNHLPNSIQTIPTNGSGFKNLMKEIVIPSDLHFENDILNKK